MQHHTEIAPSSPKVVSGFTLLELLVAMVIIGLLALSFDATDDNDATGQAQSYTVNTVSSRYKCRGYAYMKQVGVCGLYVLS